MQSSYHIYLIAKNAPQSHTCKPLAIFILGKAVTYWFYTDFTQDMTAADLLLWPRKDNILLQVIADPEDIRLGKREKQKQEKEYKKEKREKII